MSQLRNNLFPPQLVHHFDLADSEEFEQSDYQDVISSNIGTNHFQPKWKSVIRQNCDNINCFCPYCGSFVQPSTQQFGCSIQGTDGICLAHRKCINKKQNEPTQFQHTKSAYTISKGYLQRQKPSSTLGGKQYILSSTIQHPLSRFKYFKVDRRLLLDQSQLYLNMEHYDEQISSYNPNFVIVPLPQMSIKINLRGIGSRVQTQTENINLNVDLSEIFVGIEVTEKPSVWVITTLEGNIWNVQVQVQLVHGSQDKQKLIQAMNFKYRHPVADSLPLIKINKILLRSKDYENKMIKSAIQNTKVSSSYEDICEESDQQGSIMSGTTLIPIRIAQPKVQQDFRAFSKTQGGSKQLQKKIKQMKSFQITLFIDEIIPYIHQLLEDDYANYMIQTLISVSNSKQRLVIFESLKERVIEVVSLKQGTFAFQQMISFMDTHEEYTLFSEIMASNFLEVATNVNGNHFLRKLIPMLPFYYNEIIITQVFVDFIELVNNKNSVCVLKVILKVIAIQHTSERVKGIKRKLVDMLTMNTERVIKNEFGNYFIQEAFEVFGQEQLKGISEFIFSKFMLFSKEKFSSSVLCKCISNYWKGSDFYDRFKSRLSPADILGLFRNKEGNKVLLELMSSQADFAFKNKIKSAISNDLPSKFNASKWTGSTGSKTGRVGGQNYTNFSDAMKDCESKNSPMTKKRYYNIQ